MMEKGKEADVKIDRQITVQAARAALLKEQQDRQVACGHEIEKILEKYNCQLVAVPSFTNDGRITAQVQIASKAN